MIEAKPKRARTCVGCGKQDDKVALLRIVRSGDTVSFDGSGRMPGRGAYVCSADCLEKAFSSRKIQRALKCGIDRSDVDRALADIAASAQTR